MILLPISASQTINDLILFCLQRLNLKSFEFEGPALEMKNALGTGVLYLEWKVCLPEQGAAKTESDVSTDPISFDPAICRVVPTASSDTLIGRGAANAAPDPVAPCRCFSTKLSLFDVCRAVISVSEDNVQDQKNRAAGEELPAPIGAHNRMPKLLVCYLLNP